INVSGTANLLECVTYLENKCAVVVVTTDKVYSNQETGVLYPETHPLGGYDPYSSSKACAELVAESFRLSFFNPSQYHLHKKGLATARAGNVIGGADWSRERLIPDIVHSLQNGECVCIRNPYAVRPWQHVLEAIRGYLLLGAKLYNTP